MLKGVLSSMFQHWIKNYAYREQPRRAVQMLCCF